MFQLNNRNENTKEANRHVGEPPWLWNIFVKSYYTGEQGLEELPSTLDISVADVVALGRKVAKTTKATEAMEIYRFAWNISVYPATFSIIEYIYQHLRINPLVSS